MDATPSPQPAEHRPWGRFVVLADAPAYKVKSLIVSPGHRLSLQTHQWREEHWTVVRGEGLVTVGDTTRIARVGDYIHIPRGERHRLANPGTQDVEIIEVQLGDAFDEADIIRYEDDYQRL